MRVCQAWWARIVKFVGRKAVVDGNGGFVIVVVVWWLGVVVSGGGGGRERRLGSSRGRARRMVKDLTMNWPPKRRPLTSEVGLKEKSDDVGFVVWSFGWWCFCFFFFSFSPIVCGWWWVFLSLV